MKRLLKTVFGLALIAGTSATVFAGNPQRSGSAGASELLINPFTRSSGWADVNVGAVKGLESTYMNVAGLARTKKTELIFSNTQWLVNSGISINNFGLAQRVSPNGVLALSFTSFNYGDWEITTTDQPDGTGGSISPSTLIIGLAYSQKFTESIFGGVNIKLYNNQMTNLGTSGVCFDAGVQYIPEKADQWKFGVTLRNIGPGISYKGDGSSLTLAVPTQGVTYTGTFESRSAKFELPVQLLLGLSYDYKLTEDHRMTFAGNYTSNSFEKDTYQLGVEYGFKKLFAVRVGYKIYDNSSDDTQTVATSGFTGGFSFDLPLNKENGTIFGISYSYRATNPFNGIHNIGARISL